jgi:hypothetical protein
MPQSKWSAATATLALALGFAWVEPAMAAPAPDKVVERLDYYFANPNAPETYRALAGLGDPQIARLDSYEASSEASELAKRYFPAVRESVDAVSSCRVDYALKTLQARIAALGETHPYVRRWIEVQQAVFRSCVRPWNDRSKPVAAEPLPAPLAVQDAALAQLQAQDRAYQSAAYAFYRGDRDGALAGFAAIARGTSPHRPAAVYMVAAIRAGSTPDFFEEKARMVPPAQSVAEIQAILADPKLAEIHPMAQALLGWVGYTVGDAPTRKAQVLATLAALEQPAAVLAKDPVAQRRYALAREDIDHLHVEPSDDPSWWVTGAAAYGPASEALRQAAKTDPLAAWALFPPSYFQSGDYLGEHAWAPFRRGAVGWGPLESFAIERAKGFDGDAAAWRHLSRSVQTAYDPKLWDEVEAEEVRAKAGDPAAAAALAFDFYHQVRMALSAPDITRLDNAAFPAAVDHMKAFPFKGSRVYEDAWDQGLQYLMTVGRVAEARRWRDEVPRPAPRAYGSVANVLLPLLAEDEDHLVAALALAPDSLVLQNQLSITELRRLAAREDLPQPIRARFARIAWGRTYALGRTVDPELDGLMRRLNPVMTRAWTSPPGRPVRPDDRRVLLDVLRTPGVNILIVDHDRDLDNPPPEVLGETGIDLYNHDDDNWWCRWKPERNDGELEKAIDDAFFGWTDLNRAYGDVAFGLRPGLEPALAESFALRSHDPAETEALARIDSAPRLLSGRVLSWVEHPRLFETREGQAEALALAVKTTRYGCYSDGEHGAYSKAAWTLLHQRFGDTEWARRTKYWFK